MVRTPYIALVLALCGAAIAQADDAARLWSEQVQALFDVQCVKCHGPIEQNAELELDTPEAALRGSYDGAVIVPGHPDQSRLYQYLAPDSDPHMPPEKQLSDEDREVVRRWIVALGKLPDAPNEVNARAQTSEPREFASPTEAIDALISEGWQRRGVAPAPAADDRTWCRRIYLDLAGRIPTADELADFLYSADASKRAALVDQLLASDAYAVRMRELWDAFLMGRGRRGNAEDRRRESGWWTFLEHDFRTSRPWNETVRDMLVARPQSPESKGATWFLFERRDSHQEIAEAVAPLVYGTRLDCAQCHDHPLAREIKQAHYWGLVAAFNRSKNVDDGAQVEESAVGGFVNFTNLHKESQPAKVALLTGKIVEEDWPDGEEEPKDSDDNYLDPAAKVKVPKKSRRAAFADLATHDNPLLARAMVNRLWATFVGRGIVHPVDEMNERNAPSHPELLDWLAVDFAASNYDVRRLVRSIVLSQVYALSANPLVQANAVAPPESFARAAERPLTAEQVARSWRIAAGLAPDDDALRRALIAAMPDVLPRDYNATFQQAQFLSGSPDLAGLLTPAAGNTADRLIAVDDPAARVRAAFLAVVGRHPDADEQAQAVAYFAATADRPAEAVGDLLWALMTSAEFLSAP
jgi:mono/diheme cytochrome c family protein